MKVIAVDVGGTHARFALAEVEDNAVALGEVITLATRDFASFEAAWREFARGAAEPLPENAGIAVAAQVGQGTIRFTNNAWTIWPDRLQAELGLEHCAIVNDFETVGHSIQYCDDEHFDHLAGRANALPKSGLLSVIGPGTGLGVAQVWRSPDGDARIHPTEGGHADFAPIDALDDALLAQLRRRHGRVSIERLVAGPAIVDIYALLAEREGCLTGLIEERAIWDAALCDQEPLAVAAACRLCTSLGSVAGDIALAHGANGVVIAGGLGLRLRRLFSRSDFARRFIAKGRFEKRMSALPVKLLTHPQPGLLGAAVVAANLGQSEVPR